MVGVPGKYKGCETCRRRRIKCTNERPYCQKCISSGRQCKGYERELVFITGTPANRGRVASHPKRSSSPKPSNTRAEQHNDLELVAALPLRPAWDDYIAIMTNGVEQQVLLESLQIPLQYIVKSTNESDDSNPVSAFTLSLSSYPGPALAMPVTEDEVDVNARCLVHLPGQNEDKKSATAFCVFLFEISKASGEPTLDSPSQNSMQHTPPEQMSTFPQHHYFSRVYRPLALSQALLGRMETFLSSTEWRTKPWVKHPKAPMDQLLDLVTFLPSLLENTDRILPLQPTLARRLEAQDLMENALALENEMSEWLPSTYHGGPESAPSYWMEENSGPFGGIPFQTCFYFKDSQTGLSLLYYWMAQIMLHRCIDTLYRTIFQVIIDAYPNVWPDLPPNLQIEPTQYPQTREFAANICRSLDSVLDNTTQPDLLAAPFTVVMSLYKELNATSQDGVLEIMWLEAFENRLLAKGQHVINALQEYRWFEIAQF